MSACYYDEDVCLLSLLSAAIAAAIEGGRCLRLSAGSLSVSGAGAVDGGATKRDSMSLSVKKG